MDAYPTTLKYQPHRDEDWRVVENPLAYVERMRSGPLPNWPEEALIEWLHRHAVHMEDYAFLGFEHLQFERVTWPTNLIPGAAAFRNPKFCSNYQNVEDRAANSNSDWLAHYMLREGTWNTPIILFDSSSVVEGAYGARIRTPLHLLEGHRRLAFFHGLKRLGKVKAEHTIWLVRSRA